MTLQEIKKLAKRRDIAVDKNMKKADIIKAMQKQEGNDDCFGQAKQMNCGEADCLWRQDCLK